MAAASAAAGDRAPKILFDPAVARATLLPDFSYAGYGFGALPLPTRMGKTIDVGDYGARPDDEIDDSKAVLKALDAAHQVKGPVTLRFGAGRYVLSEVLMIRRSHIAIEGAGQGAGGTQLYFTRPLRMVDKSDRLDGLREYLRA
ncbi:glycosyl hydrolase family 28-related protein, partial [Lysobacter sp. 2RAB21]